MPIELDRHGVQRLREQGAVVIEVLPAQEYEMEHIAGAIHVPLKELNAAAVAGLRRDRPLVVYCDSQQ